MIASAVVLAGCRGPWGAVADAERPWWQDAARLEASADLDLVDLRSAEPIGWWPRLVVRPDRIELDDRAVVLALGEEALAAPDAADRLVEVRVGTAAQDGFVLPELAAALEALDRALRDTDARSDPLVVVPDARVRADVLVPALFTAARYGDFTLAGANEGRLRTPLVSGPPCGAQIEVEVGGSSAVRGRGGEVVVDGSGACPLPAAALATVVRSVAHACEPVWADAFAEPERCFTVAPAIGPDATAAEVLGFLGELHGAANLRTGALAIGAGSVSCATALPVDQLPPDALRRLCTQPAGLWARLPPEAEETP